jgi:hypothetical protein
MTYKTLLNKLQKFSPKDLRQEVMVELNTTDFGDWLVGDIKEIKKIKDDSDYYDRVGEIYLT